MNVKVLFTTDCFSFILLILPNGSIYIKKCHVYLSLVFIFMSFGQSLFSLNVISNLAAVAMIFML